MVAIIKHICLAVFLVTCNLWAASAQPQTSFAIYDHPKYRSDFSHFDYVNPHAPKGGEVHISSMGTFDTFNPFIVRGTPEQNIGLTTATLMIQSSDEVGSCYPYVAQSLTIDPQGRYIIFTLNPKAVFNNGEKITADDVVFSFDILKKDGQPSFRQYYKDVEKAEALSPTEVKFHIKEMTNRELPLVLGQLPILSKKFYQTHSFSEPTLAIPPSSGPYQILKYDAGRIITYERVKNWWASNLPTTKGFYNFDLVHIDYFRDTNALFESFKAGKCDWRQEIVARLWATSYNFPAVEKGMVIKQTLPEYKAITYGFAFNTSNALFSDRRIRKALTLMYNFPWANKNLFFGEYQRCKSYFNGIRKLMALGLPQGEELQLLKKFQKDLPLEVFTQEFTLPSEDSPEAWHNVIKEAELLFKEAGWVIKDFKMVHKDTGKPFEFQFLTYDKSIERVVGNYVENLKRLGITLNISVVDSANYQERATAGKYDMILMGYLQSHTPGNEQRFFWHSSTANVPGTRNLANIKNPVVDALIDSLIKAETYASLCARTRALDRVLLWNYYIVPAWSSNHIRIAYWNRFGRPGKLAKYGPFQPYSWWIDATKDSKIQNYKEGSKKGLFTFISESFLGLFKNFFKPSSQDQSKAS